MDSRALTYAAAHPHYFDVPWSPHARDGSPSLVGEVPPGWHATRHGPWAVLAPLGALLPAAGWKIHVSAHPDNAAAAVTASIECCVRLGVAVKHLATQRLVQLNQAKYADQTSSGKILTAYPKNVAESAALVRALRACLAGVTAARVIGEHCAPDAPVSVRFGGYHPRWTYAADGQRVPALLLGGAEVIDVRGVAGPPLPPELHEALGEAAPSPVVLPGVEGVTVLHRSNAGGVYLARRGGAEIVIKEGRRHTGLDHRNGDGWSRVRHEWLILQRLRGSGAAPEPLDFVDAGSSALLVMSAVPGEPLTRRMAAEHPGGQPDGGSPVTSRAYREWTDRVETRLAELLRTIHERGVAHGDLHPSNVLDDGVRLTLVDFESGSLDGESVSVGIGAEGFASAAGPSPMSDVASAQQCVRVLRNPLAGVLVRRPDLLTEVEGTDVGLGSEAGSSVAAAVDDGFARRLWAGFSVAATADRQDRLFPGHYEQFTSPGAGSGLLHGAAGVLLVLAGLADTALTQSGLPSEWIDWLADVGLSDTDCGRGLANGVDGVMRALVLLGRQERVEAWLERGGLGQPPVDQVATPGWAHGWMGWALAAAETAGCLPVTSPGRAELVRQAGMLTQTTLARLADPSPPAGYAPGLTAGWAGVGLCLLRMAELEIAGLSPADLREAAGVCLRREAVALREVGSGLLAETGGRLLPYLGRGSAAAGVLASDLLDTAASSPWEPDPQVVQLAHRIRAGVIASLHPPVIVEAGLLDGRAGLLATARLLHPEAAAHSAVKRHLSLLRWHEAAAVSPREPGAAGAAQPLGDGMASVLAGQHQLRCSYDLATGSAGALLAMDGSATLIRRLLGFPRLGDVIDLDLAGAWGHSVGGRA